MEEIRRVFSLPSILGGSDRNKCFSFISLAHPSVREDYPAAWIVLRQVVAVDGVSV
jgi:hypothetical protein